MRERCYVTPSAGTAVPPRREPEPPAVPVGVFARVTGLSLNGAYDAVQRGEVESIRFGRKILVLTAPVRRLLQLDQEVAATTHV